MTAAGEASAGTVGGGTVTLHSTAVAHAGSRRHMLRRAASVLAAATGGLLSLRALHGMAQSVPRRVVIEAVKFEYKPDQVSVVLGQAVTLVIRSPDFAHGFSLPDFNLRADALPGKDVEVTFTPNKAGRFAWVCDNFCGEGHDEMSGWFTVTPA